MMTKGRMQAHSSNRGQPDYVTKVQFPGVQRIKAAILCLFCSLWPPVALSQTQPEKPAEALYVQLGRVKLNPSRIFQVREASLDRSAIHITLEDGTIGFTEDVMG